MSREYLFWLNRKTRSGCNTEVTVKKYKFGSQIFYVTFQINSQFSFFFNQKNSTICRVSVTFLYFVNIAKTL